MDLYPKYDIMEFLKKNPRESTVDTNHTPNNANAAVYIMYEY